MMIRRTARLVTLWMLPLALAGGCRSKTTAPVPTPSPYPAQDSPANCLAILQRAYVERDPERYAKLFPRNFLFQFRAGGPISHDNPMPQMWGADEESTAANHMFRSVPVEKIRLSFVNGPAINCDWCPGPWKVEVTDIDLGVDVRYPAKVRYIVPHGTATFYFKEYPGEMTESGNPIWRICAWEDHPIGGVRAAPRVPAAEVVEADSVEKMVTWGNLKWLYYRQEP